MNQVIGLPPEMLTYFIYQCNSVICVSDALPGSWAINCYHGEWKWPEIYPFSVYFHSNFHQNCHRYFSNLLLRLDFGGSVREVHTDQNYKTCPPPPSPSQKKNLTPPPYYLKKKTKIYVFVFFNKVLYPFVMKNVYFLDYDTLPRFLEPSKNFIMDPALPITAHWSIVSYLPNTNTLYKGC